MRLFVIATLALTLMSGTANAQAQFVAPQCRGHVPESVRFDDEKHRLWYARFWTGRCVSGIGWCLPGSPNWTESVPQLVAQAPPARQAEATQRLCALGHLVGLEWAKENAIRRIDTNALRGFERTLRDTRRGDVFVRIAAVDAEARRMLERRR